MDTLFAFATFVSFIAFIVGLSKSSQNKRLAKKNPNFKPKHNWKNVWLYSMIAMLAFGALFSATDTSSSSDSADSSSSSEQSSQSSSSSSSESHVTTASDKKKEGIAAKDSSSDKDSSSAKKSSSTDKAEKAKAKKAQEQKNFRQYEKALRKLPKQSNGAFTSAYYDFSKKETILVANNAVLNGTDAQVKSAVHQAWLVGQRYDEHYEPLPDDIMAYRITVQDDAGDQLAHTGVLGGFKYDFDD